MPQRQQRPTSCPSRDTMPDAAAQVRVHVNVGKKFGESLGVPNLADLEASTRTGRGRPMHLTTTGRRDLAFVPPAPRSVHWEPPVDKESRSLSSSRRVARSEARRRAKRWHLTRTFACPRQDSNLRPTA